jgi:serine/threonine protein kinase
MLKTCILQVVSALRYLNMQVSSCHTECEVDLLHHICFQKNRIIHYDLKPANVLIHRGEVVAILKLV